MKSNRLKVDDVIWYKNPHICFGIVEKVTEKSITILSYSVK